MVIYVCCVMVDALYPHWNFPILVYLFLISLRYFLLRVLRVFSSVSSNEGIITSY